MSEQLLERELEKKCKDWARSRGWWARKFTSPAHRSSPDDIFAKGGVVLFVEFKRAGKQPTPLQQHEHEVMRSFGLTVQVIDTVFDFHRLLTASDTAQTLPLDWNRAAKVGRSVVANLAEVARHSAQDLAIPVLGDWDV